MDGHSEPVTWMKNSPRIHDGAKYEAGAINYGCTGEQAATMSARILDLMDIMTPVLLPLLFISSKYLTLFSLSAMVCQRNNTCRLSDACYISDELDFYKYFS